MNAYKNRIKIIIDIPNNRTLSPVSCYYEDQTKASSLWHGTMTSVICAGDGYLSKGLYKGIACNVKLVLLKVQDNNGKITTANIVKALEWILQHHGEYNIRIVNISVGADEAISYKQSAVDILSEQLIEDGVVIVAAVGNDEKSIIKPPANSLNVIAVGGIDDGNKLAEAKNLYHSSFGITMDDLMKPELVAQAIWIAAPILPGTKEQQESEGLHCLVKTNDNQLPEKFSDWCKTFSPGRNSGHENDVTFIRNFISNRIKACKYISPHYMHVDGTSFAALIVSAVIAQMLEADPHLTPPMIRQVLFSTAKRIDGLAAEPQGFGVIQPKKALLKILKNENIMKPHVSPYVNGRKKMIEFYVHHDCASQISLAGSFNHWATDVLLMEPGKKGVWKIEIPMLPAGKYHYKFFVDDKMWLEDLDNPYRVPDGYHGFNSILVIENQNT
ncbi:MAG: S8 family serine peptidase [Chitinophagaceae bacterium]